MNNKIISKMSYKSFKEWYKSYSKEHSFVARLGLFMNDLRNTLFPVQGKNNIVKIKGNIRGLKKIVIGNDNILELNNCILTGVTIRIQGNGNHLVIEEGCKIGKKCSFWLIGDNNTIIVGKQTTMNRRCHFMAQEQNTKIIVGEDCMFSNTIIVRTSDSHPIYNAENQRINPAKDVVVGKHVWIAPSSVIMKGAIIGDGCVVGSHSMVNKMVPDNCLIVGIPAHVVKEGIHWARHFE